jgi:hypothetical protein
MKYNLLNTSQTLIFIALFLTTGLFTSCEKAELDTGNINNLQNQPSTITEFFFVEEDMWSGSATTAQYSYSSDNLNKKDLDKEVKLFVKTRKEHSSPNIWMELPTNDLYFTIRGNVVNIYCPADWPKKDCTFKLEIGPSATAVPKTDFDNSRNVRRVDMSKASSKIIDDIY